MTIRHAVLFSFKANVAEHDRAALLADIRRFPEHHQAMRRFAVGPNTSTRDRTYSHMMIVDFGDRAELDEYLSSERHETFVRERFAPLISARAIATLEEEGGEGNAT